MSDAATQDACQVMARKTAHHEALARFAGKWRAEVRFFSAPPGMPPVSHGTMSSTLVLGDRFLQQEYRDDSGLFEGRGFWGYNTVDGRFEGFWIDSMASFFQVEHGEHDATGDTYTMRGTLTDPTTRQPLQKRSVIRYLEPDAHTLEMFFTNAQGQEGKAMEIRYTRA
jgi:hypothetical protein